MPAITTLAAVAGVALAGAGAYQNYSAAHQNSSATEQLSGEKTGLQQQAEAVRLQAMKIDADRKRRQAIRQGMIARSQALTSATSQGANKGSALQGAYGQVQGETNFTISGINEQEQLGQNMFDINSQILSVNQRMAAQSARNDTSRALGTGLSSLGGTLVSNLGAIDRISGNIGGTRTTTSSTGGYSLGGSASGGLGVG